MKMAAFARLGTLQGSDSKGRTGIRSCPVKLRMEIIITGSQYDSDDGP